MCTVVEIMIWGMVMMFMISLLSWAVAPLRPALSRLLGFCSYLHLLRRTEIITRVSLGPGVPHAGKTLGCVPAALPRDAALSRANVRER